MANRSSFEFKFCTLKIRRIVEIHCRTNTFYFIARILCWLAKKYVCIILFNSFNAMVVLCFVRETSIFSISISDICYSNDGFYSFNVKTTNGYYFPVQFWVELFWFILKHFFRTFLVFFCWWWDRFYRLHIVAILKNGLSALESCSPTWSDYWDRLQIPDMWPLMLSD